MAVEISQGQAPVQVHVTPINSGLEVLKAEEDLLRTKKLTGEDNNIFDSVTPVDGKGTDIIHPRYNPIHLQFVAMENNALLQCVEAMEINVDGTGYSVERADGHPLTEDDAKAVADVRDFFDHISPEGSFITVRRRLRRDLEMTGNGYLEVLRDAGGEIVFINHLESGITRIVKKDSPVRVEETIKRGGRERRVRRYTVERRYAQVVGTKLVYFKQFGAKRRLHARLGCWEGDSRLRTPENKEGLISDKDNASEIMHFILHKDPLLPYGNPRWISQTPSVVGSREAEEYNVAFFKHGGLPPALIFIAGGAMSETHRNALSSYLGARAKNKQRGAIVELFSTSGELGGTGAGNVKVTVERFGCYSRDTEVLTEKGWVPFPKWRGEKVASFDLETEQLRFDDPIGGLQEYDYEGDMILFYSTRQNALVTPNHNMVTVSPVGNLEKDRADSLFTRQDIKFLTSIQGEDGDSELTGEDADAWVDKVFDGDVNGRLTLPKSMLSMGMDDSRRLMHSILSRGATTGDVDAHPHVYNTKRAELADGLQILALRCGYQSYISGDIHGRDGVRQVHILPADNPLDGPDVEYSAITGWKGKVYCFETPTGTLVTRRMGTIGFHGNSERQQDGMFLNYDKRCKEHIRGAFRLPPLFMGEAGEANFACHDDKTEFLSDNGWVRGVDYVPGMRVGQVDPDTGVLTFVTPLAYGCREVSDVDMHTFNNRAVNMSVTPNHNMLHKRKGVERGWDFCKVEELPGKFLLRTTYWHEEGEPLERIAFPSTTYNSPPLPEFKGDDFIEYVGWVVSDGHCTTERRIQITQHEDRYLDEILELLDRMGMPYKVSGATPVKQINTHRTPLAKWFATHVKAKQQKQIPDSFMTLPRRQLRILFAALMKGDGYVHPITRSPMTYTTISPKLADQVQALANRLGYRATIRVRSQAHSGYGSPKPLHVINICGLRTVEVAERDMARETYSGKVWCFEVPKKAFLVRREGNVSVSGNSAYVAHIVSEAQIFLPERQEFDEFINMNVMPHVNDDYRIRSNPVGVSDIQQQLLALQLGEDYTDPDSLLENINQTANLNLKLRDGVDEDLMMQEVQNQLTNAMSANRGKAPEGSVTKIQATEDGLIAKMDDAFYGMLVTDWSQHLSGARKFDESAINDMKHIIGIMDADVRKKFDGEVGSKLVELNSDDAREAVYGLIGLAGTMDKTDDALEIVKGKKRMRRASEARKPKKKLNASGKGKKTLKDE